MIKLSDVEALISNSEINDLILELELETSVLRMTPSDVSTLSDEVERKNTLAKIELLDKLYVLPMRELANRIYAVTNNGLAAPFNGLENLSIRGRMFKIREFLLSKGCNIETIMRVVPKTEEELSILLNASSLGFDLGFNEHQTLDNDDRIMRAQEFINRIMIEQNNKIINIDEVKEEEKGGYGRVG